MNEAVAAAFAILTLRLHREGQYWVGECEELGTATDGRSLVKVRSELEQLVALHLHGLEDAHERERFLQEHGIQLYTDGIPATVNRELPVSQDADTLVEARTIRLPNFRRDLVSC